MYVLRGMSNCQFVLKKACVNLALSSMLFSSVYYFSPRFSTAVIQQNVIVATSAAVKLT